MLGLGFLTYMQLDNYSSSNAFHDNIRCKIHVKFLCYSIDGLLGTRYLHKTDPYVTQPLTVTVGAYCQKNSKLLLLQ